MIQIILAAGCNIGAIQFNPVCFFSAAPFGAVTNAWFPIFMMVIAIVIAIIAIIYALSPLVGRNDMKTWCKVKLYELMMTIVIAFIFLAMSTLLYTVNPSPALKQVGILPQTCDPTVGGNVPSSAGNTNIYSVALCDMYQYNSRVASFSEGVFLLAMVGGLAPVVNINAVSDVGGITNIPGGGATGSGVEASPGIGFSIAFQLLPIQFVLQYIVPLMSAYFAAVMIAIMQQIMLSAAMILFSSLMIIGLVARAFSITKTFGGAMIAFALGIGFIYPLMTIMSYGFLNVVLINAQAANGGGAAGQFEHWLLYDTLGLGGAIGSYLGTGNTAQIANIMTPFIISGGFVASGLMLLPLINLIVVDAFIVDLSRVIGERMELMSLLTRII